MVFLVEPESLVIFSLCMSEIESIVLQTTDMVHNSSLPYPPINTAWSLIYAQVTNMKTSKS